MADQRPRAVYTARGATDGEDWQAVADALNARMAARRIGQQELANLSGLSVSTLRQLQHGAGRRVQNRTLAQIARALGWPDDHLVRVLVEGSHADESAGSVPSGSAHGQIVERLDHIEDAIRQLTRRLDELSSPR